MQDVASASLTKERILQHIRGRGPSLPVHIARAVNLSQLFASAFLSELYREGKIKISNIRVGSSPLYYLEGQEPMLENFMEHLNQKEREALMLIKDKKFLFDEELQPAIRVAIRALKDFALPINKEVNGEQKTIWRYFQSHESEMPSQRQAIKPENTLQSAENKREEITQVKNSEKSEDKNISEEIKPEESGPKHTEHKSQKSKVKKSNSEEKFLENIKAHIQSRGMELTEIISEKKKDFTAKVKADMPFGKQEFLLIFRDKKKLNEDDLAVILHKANQEKMPSILLTPGEVDKKSQEYLKTWRNLLKIEKVKF